MADKMLSFHWICQGYDLAKVDFTWKIPAPIHECSSPLFSSEEMKESQWQLEIKDNLIDCLVKHFDSDGDQEDLHMPTFSTMSVLNERGQTILKQTGMSECREPYIVFYTGYREMSQQKDGILTFRVKIYSHVKKEVPGCVPQSTVDSSDGLVTDLEGLFENMKFSDVIFNIRGRLVPAHKNILAARSKVFDAMFQHPFQEKASNHVKIEDIDPEVFHELLRFIYTGRMALDKMEVMADGLLMAADKYLVDGLKTKWESYLVLYLSPVNCLKLLLHGDLLSKNPTETLEKAAKFFRRHPIQVMATDEWKKAKEDNPSLLCDIQEFVYRYE